MLEICGTISEDRTYITVISKGKEGENGVEEICH